MTNDLISLYIFSGPHLGANISIGEGKTVIGSDDSADIILLAQKSNSDFAISGRHAIIEVSEIIEQGISVILHELDGKISAPGLEIEGERLQVQAGQVFYLGATCFVWNYANVEQESILPNLGLLSQVSLSENTENFKELAFENEASEEDTSANLVDNIEEANDKLVLSATQKKKNHIFSLIVYGALIIVLLALSVFTIPENSNYETELEMLKTNLTEIGLGYLKVEAQKNNGQNSIGVSGFVNSESERKKVQDLARSLHYPVYLSLGVNSDILRAVQDVFFLYGIFPKLEVKNGKLKVSAYIKDSLVEEAIFLALSQDVKTLPDIEKNIVYAAEVALLLESKLNEEKVDYADIVYNSGQIAIVGKFTVAEIYTIQKIMDEITASLNIPITYILQEGEKIKLAEPSKPKETNAVSQTLGVFVDSGVLEDSGALEGSGVLEKTTNGSETGDPTQLPTNLPTETYTKSFDNVMKGSGPMGSIKVMAINTEPIPFVTTSDGQKLFIGAVMPSGYVLEEIRADSLVFRDGMKVETVNIKNLN